jgi:DNA (cytosine-5)-methyltransferase 1
MTKIKYLNLFAGLGGNAKKLDRNKYEITAVEMDPKIANVYQDNNREDKVIIGDAMEYLKNNRNKFDLVGASPPCQKHSRMMKATRHDVADFFDPMLWQVIVFLSHFYKGSWFVENVIPYYEPLIKPRIQLGRHLIWSNFKITNFDMPNIKNFSKTGTIKETERFKEWLGIHYEGNIYYKGNHCPGQVLRNCMHPDLGLHIINCFEQARKLNSINYKQTALNFN